MHIASALLAAVAAPAVALASRGDSSSWKPAQETDSVDKGANNVQGWSPRTTDGPKPLFGRMDLAKRLEGYTLGPATCGFVSTDNDIIGCQSAGLTCAYQDGYAGCCVPNKPCSAVKTKCINYSQSVAGACLGLLDAHTVCCGTSSMGGCYTWEVSIGSAEGRSSGVYTVFDCSATAGIGQLLDYDPAWARTHSFPSTTSSAPSPTQTDDSSEGSDSNSDDEDNGGGKKKKSNVGAIAGGAVGGVAALALLGTAIFFCMRRKKKDGKDSQNASPPAPMSQQPYSPASPGASYPSGAPNQYGYPPQPYSPGSNNYNQQQQPYSPGYQQQYAQQQQYAPSPQQQWGQGPYDPTSPSAVSPGTHTSQTPPAFHTSTSPVGDHSKSPPPQNVSELGAVNPVGADTNRAELG